MNYSLLYLWVEGSDDERFMQKVVCPQFRQHYQSIQIIQYSKKSYQERAKFLNSIIKMGADYIYFADINSKPCVTAKKQEIKAGLQNIEEDKIVIVVKEIESWYLAGVSRSHYKLLGVDRFYQKYKTSDNANKEKFEQLMSNNFDSRIDFMQEILKHFNLETARNNNSSFQYFFDKYRSCLTD